MEPHLLRSPGWKVLRVENFETLAGLHLKHKSNLVHVVELGREFDDDLAFFRWAFEHELLTAGELLSAPCHGAVKHPPKRLHLSDTNFDTIGGYCPELKEYWR